MNARTQFEARTTGVGELGEMKRGSENCGRCHRARIIGHLTQNIIQLRGLWVLVRGRKRWRSAHACLLVASSPLFLAYLLPPSTEYATETETPAPPRLLWLRCRPAGRLRRHCGRRARGSSPLATAVCSRGIVPYCDVVHMHMARACVVSRERRL